MRKLIIAVVVLVGVGLVFLWRARDEAPEAALATSREQHAAQVARAGTRLQPVSSGDEGARGTASAGSTPALEQAPSEADGMLEVEVLAGTRPVPGATVRLYLRGARDPNLDEVSWRLASERSTDEQGLARLASKPGGYLVAVRAPGYAPLLRDVVRPYGEALTHLRLTVEPGHTLTGRTVARDSQEPLPLVELVLTAHGRKLEPWQPPAAPAEERTYASSDARGNFRVEGLAPGKYQLEARAPGHALSRSTVQVPTREPLTVVLQAASIIEGFVVDAQGTPAAGAEVQVSSGNDPQTVTTGQGGGFSLEVAPGAHTVSARRGTEAGSLDRPLVVGAGKTVRDVRLRLGPSAGVEGRVYAKTTGAPVAGASVDVSPHGISGDSGRAVTDGTGHFSVGGLAPGSYDVVVSAPGFSSLTRGGLTVSAGERFPVELELAGTGAVEGEVRGRAGQPLQGIQVVGGSRWGGALGSMPAEARTDAAGHYRLEGLSAGLLSLSVKREGSLLGTAQRLEVREGKTVRADFVLGDSGTVEGVVRAAQGTLPSEPLFVTAIPRTRRGGMPDMVREEVGPGGSFRMNLPPDTYGLLVSMQVRGGFSGRGSTEVQVESGKTVRVELTWQRNQDTGPRIQGVVLEPDGVPSLRAIVTYGPEDGGGLMPEAASTDEQGRFSLSVPSDSAFPMPPSMGTGTAPARMKLSAYNGGRTGTALGVKPGDQNVVVQLEHGLLVRGRVVRAARGEPVKGFTLSIELQGQYPFWLGNTYWEFAADRFELRDVPAAPVKLVVRTPEGARGEALMPLGSEALSELIIPVMEPATLTGRVIDATTGAPMDNAFVLLEGRHPSNSINTRSDGVFRLDDLPAGESRLTIRTGSSYMPEHRTVTLVEGQVTDLGDIALRPVRKP
jgi:hypothetical protein